MAARSRSGSSGSGKKALGAALIARGLTGGTGRDAKTGRKKSPGLIGSILIVVFGGVFLGVGLYLHSNSASLQAQPDTKGSPEVAGWICIAVGGLIVLIGGLTLLNRITCLLIGVGLLIVGLFERTQPVYVPASGGGGSGSGSGSVSGGAAAGAEAPAQSTPAPGDGQSAGPLLPPPIDPRLPMPGR